MRLERDDAHEHPIHVLVMDDGDNVLGDAWIAGMHEALDVVEAFDAPTALVVTGQGKFFSSGVDIHALLSRSEAEIDEQFRGIFAACARILGSPLRTVAGLNGHTFGGAAMFSMCFDSRVMRADRGWWCVPEADLGTPLHPAMSAVLQARLPVSVCHRAIVTAHRFDGPEALAAGIVDRVEDGDGVRPAAVAMAAAGATKDRGAQRVLKRGLYAEVLALLAEPAPLDFGLP